MAFALHCGIGAHAILRGPQDLWWQARQNQLLAALPAVDYERLRCALKPVTLPLGEVLCEAGIRAEHAYFPVTGIASLTQELASGDAAEVAVAGNDGLVGIALVMGGETTTTRAFVRAAGMGYCMRADTLQMEFERCHPLRRILLRYAQSLLTQVAQTAVCLGHHTVEQQVCRILLSTADRSASDDLALTQEMIGDLVGVRRESVTAAAGALQSAGIIHYRRGWITVLDRPALARRACECHAAIKREALRLFTQPCVRPSQPAEEPHRALRDFAFGARGCGSRKSAQDEATADGPGRNI